MNIVYIIIIVIIVFDEKSFLKNVFIRYKLFFRNRNIILIEFYEFFIFVIEILIRNIFDYLISFLLLLNKKAKF